MNVDKKLLQRVAQLARLDLTDREIERFTLEFKEVLSAFSKLDEVDVTGVEPSFHPIPLSNAMREDTVQPSLSREAALSNSTHTKDGYFKGPKAV